MTDYLKLAQDALDRRRDQIGESLASDREYAAWTEAAQRHYRDRVHPAGADPGRHWLKHDARAEARAVNIGLDPALGHGIVAQVLDVFGDSGVEVANGIHGRGTLSDPSLLPGNLKQIWKDTFRYQIRQGLTRPNAESRAWGQIQAGEPLSAASPLPPPGAKCVRTTVPTRWNGPGNHLFTLEPGSLGHLVDIGRWPLPTKECELLARYLWRMRRDRRPGAAIWLKGKARILEHNEFEFDKT